MKTPHHEPNAVHMPPELLAEARKAADEEHRATDELVSEAVRRYLQQRKQQNIAPRQSLTQFLMDSPFAGANLDLERRKHAEAPPRKRTLLDLFEPLRGLDVEFPRNPSTGRPLDL